VKFLQDSVQIRTLAAHLLSAPSRSTLMKLTRRTLLATTAAAALAGRSQLSFAPDVRDFGST
jgi:hypothetical protein